MYGPKLSTIPISEIVDGSYLYIPNARDRIDSQITSNFAKVIDGAFEDRTFDWERIDDQKETMAVFVHFCLSGFKERKDGRFISNTGKYYDFRLRISRLIEYDSEFIKNGFKDEFSVNIPAKYRY